jgi:ABC-type antimicrobial peptide transport system permease subunit
MVQTCMGLAIGTLGAFLAGRAISAQLYEVAAFDTKVVAFAIVVLALSATAAAALPARRAASINPAAALRAE